MYIYSVCYRRNFITQFRTILRIKFESIWTDMGTISHDGKRNFARARNGYNLPS